MLSVANMRKTLYPMLLMMVSVTLDTTKSKGIRQMMLSRQTEAQLTPEPLRC